MTTRAVFLDRDGVINAERHHVHRVEDVALLPGVPEALRRLQSAGWRLVVVTNQSGIARGYFTEDDYRRVARHLDDELARQGVRLDAVRHCPHLPEAAVAAYRRRCHCRKPLPGMLLDAAAVLGVDLSRSVMIGDKPSDIEAGRAAGVGACFAVRSGHPFEPGAMDRADAVLADLAACADRLLGTDPGQDRGSSPNAGGRGPA